MKLSELRKKGGGFKEQISNRTKESFNVKDDSGKFGKIFNKKFSMDRFKATEGEHAFDILPWVVGSKYPTKNYPNIKPGDIQYILDVWVHFGIGVNEDAIVCPARNYNLPCPVCEEFTQLKKEGTDDPELLDPLKPRRRAIYQIICRNSAAEENKGVQLFDSPHYYTERIISEMAKKPFGGGFVFFSDPDEGKQIYFKRKGMGRNTEYVGHRFEERDYTISDELLDSTVSLDDYLVLRSYEEIKAMHEGAGLYTESQEETKDEAPVEKREPELPAEQPPEEKKETKSRTRSRAPLSKPKEEKKEEAAGPQTCPGGGVFATDDIDTLDHCSECEIWEDCAKAKAAAD